LGYLADGWIPRTCRLEDALIVGPPQIWKCFMREELVHAVLAVFTCDTVCFYLFNCIKKKRRCTCLSGNLTFSWVVRPGSIRRLLGLMK
jgi:hypothetical protein